MMRGAVAIAAAIASGFVTAGCRGIEDAQAPVAAAASESAPAQEPASAPTSVPEAPVPKTPVPELAAPPPSGGPVFAHGGGPLRADLMRAFVALCGDAPTVVLIPTASNASDRRSYRDKIVRPWGRLGAARVRVVHAKDHDAATNAALSRRVADADCVWIGGGDQGRLERIYGGTPVEAAVVAAHRRGKTIGGYSAGAAFLSRVMIRRGNPEPEQGVGLGVVPGAVIDQHFLRAKREGRLLTVLADHPDLVGYGIAEETALVIRGDTVEVLGRSVVRRCRHAAGCEDLPAGYRGPHPPQGVQ